VGELARAADALLRPGLAHGLIAATLAVLAGRWWWPTVAGSVAVVVGLAWVAAVAAPAPVGGAAVVALVLPAAAAVVLAGAAPPARMVPAAGAVGVVAALGVFAVVPDTERALALLGAVVVSAVAVRRLDRRWLATVALAAAWVAVVDGDPRGSAIAGGLGCAALPGLLAVWPDPPSSAHRRRWAVVALALAGTALCSRVAGRRSSTLEAVAMVVLVVATLAFVRQRRPKLRRRGPSTDRP